MSAPLIGICGAIERVSWGAWTEVEVVLAPRNYVRSVSAAGGAAVILPPDERGESDSDAILDRLDGVMLAGGADIDPGSYGAEPHEATRGTWPERDRFEIALMRRALEREVPVLGICRGMQLMNVALGGTLDQNMPDTVGHLRHREVPGTFSTHRVRLRDGSLAADAVGGSEASVSSHHHQGIDALGEGLFASGWADDDETVEALEMADGGYALGVLWHPEEDLAAA